MEKKDVIQYYLHCQFETKYGNAVVEHYSPYDIEGNIEMDVIDIDRFDCFISEIKPLLRPLSDMNHSNVCDLAKIGFKIFSDTYTFKADLNEPKRISKYGSGCRVDIFNNQGEYVDSVVQSWSQLSAEQFNYMLKQGFDIFQLIENGLAINKTLTP